jgi:uncharacterized tellurite resistance protein B-like protein
LNVGDVSTILPTRTRSIDKQEGLTMNFDPGLRPTKFDLVLGRLDVARRLLEPRLAAARRGGPGGNDDVMAALVGDLAEEMETDFAMEVADALSASSAARSRPRGGQTGDAGRLETLAWDPHIARCFGFVVPVLAAASLQGRDPDDPARRTEIAPLLARTAVWLLGRSSIPDPSAVAMDPARAGRADPAAAARVAGLWISRLGMARAIPSAFGQVLVCGLDYFAAWAAGAVALRFYDDFELTLDESMEVAREAQHFQGALVCALVRVARADGHLGYEEEEMLRIVLDHLAFSASDREACLGRGGPEASPMAEDLLASVPVPSHRAFILARAADMAFADRRETRSEKAVLRDLARLLGVPVSQVQARETAVRGFQRMMAPLHDERRPGGARRTVRRGR